MKVIKHENGIELVPETDFEIECLRHIANRSIHAEWTDKWDSSGNLKVEFPKDSWN
jgi:hypothetical protein